MVSGKELAEGEGFEDEEEIIDKFGVFYQMKLWEDILPKLKGLKGTEFKSALGALQSEYAEQYSPYDFYKELKTKEKKEFDIDNKEILRRKLGKEYAERLLEKIEKR